MGVFGPYSSSTSTARLPHSPQPYGAPENTLSVRHTPAARPGTVSADMMFNCPGPILPKVDLRLVPLQVGHIEESSPVS
jgi:hypothetical protein